MTASHDAHGGNYEKHPLVKQFEEAYTISQHYHDRLEAEALRKGWVGKEVDKKTLDEIVNFFHSDEVVEFIKQSIGTRAEGLSKEVLLGKYGLPKHVIKDLIAYGKSISSQDIGRIVLNFQSRLHSQLSDHIAGSISNVAYDKGHEVAQNLVLDLYRTAGGDRYAASVEDRVRDLKAPDKILQHVQGSYEALTGEMARHAPRKPVYKAEPEGHR
ncbi:hypothetical protein HYW21_00560 [Candidatus Woesearchaeota archaeon]|nr:hypothetical protein [Candidatus Woesearchaeota archaeon]